MKAIPGNSSGPQWKNSLLDDLVFIKKHLRYPMSRRTIPSVFLIAVFLVLGFRMLWLTVLVSEKGNTLVGGFLATMLVICFVTGVMRYWNTLRFRSISTPFFAQENMKLVEAFLGSQQLNMYRHPNAPEVLQILSRPLGNNTEQREVMIFIADDKRILINSHFTKQKWSISAASRNSGQMAKRLKMWIERPQTPKGASPHFVNIGGPHEKLD